MKKLSSIFLALSISLIASETQTRTGTFPEKEMKTQNKEIAQMVAKEISSTLPQIIDKYTTLSSVKNNDTTLVYTFEINTGVKSDETVQKEDRTRMKQAVTTGICQSSRKFLEAGINTSYVYVSAKTKVRLFQFDIAQKDCPTNIN
ncbi:hypothetical protein SMGD1_2347 [Sulfurimonas gotlandica GD1]|uniref:Uncharacterized protein n=1 Tax=Sulfurimonas gotlandica (strain DSM 19862 / JCM 16533 / GD1) TaxID=929558 RepID=B6BML4_SULGG|nr:hypothetical protein [Sulfurimonas gotlandica]EDZ61674.1 conserved hypothetical protein [Sulfurimonas gotlandica GD1]EHP30870.1 hypothetical protein SMGD1_2347 [Sulfurimonas gotlandica GD1]